MTIDYAHLLVRQRFLLCIITLLVGGFVAFGISKTVQDNSTEAILAQDDPYKEEIDQNKADFPSSPSILFAFEIRLQPHECSLTAWQENDGDRWKQTVIEQKTDGKKKAMLITHIK